MRQSVYPSRLRATERCETPVLDADKKQRFPVELYRAGIEDRIHGKLPMLALQDRIALVAAEELLFDLHVWITWPASGPDAAGLSQLRSFAGPLTGCHRDG